jgi:hypothetical protein
MKTGEKLLILALSGVIAACGGGGNSGADTNSADPADMVTGPETGTKLVILNRMTPSGKIIDAVVMSSVQGSNSVGDVDQVFTFEEAVEYNGSGIVYIPDDKCDLYWDLSPTSSELESLIANSVENVFVGCGATVTCTATIKDVAGFDFGNLDCEE